MSNRIKDRLDQLFSDKSYSVPADSAVPEGMKGMLLPAPVPEIGKLIVEIMEAAPDNTDDLTEELLDEQGRKLMQIQALAMSAAVATAMVAAALKKKKEGECGGCN